MNIRAKPLMISIALALGASGPAFAQTSADNPAFDSDTTVDGSPIRPGVTYQVEPAPAGASASSVPSDVRSRELQGEEHGGLRNRATTSDQDEEHGGLRNRLMHSDQDEEHGGLRNRLNDAINPRP